MESLWLRDSSTKYKTLKMNQSAEVVVIGAGISGLSAAYFLAKRGVDVVVLEANKIASNTTGNTTGKISAQQNLKYSYLLKHHGFETVKLFANANLKAIELMEEIISKENIECDYVHQNAYTFTAEDDFIENINNESKILNEVGIKSQVTQKENFILPYKAAVCTYNQGMFNPYEYLSQLSDAIIRYGGRIFENSRVTKVEQGKVHTKKACVEAKKIILATHVPIVNFPGMYFAKIEQMRSYIIALKCNEQVNGMWISADKPTKSIRTYKDYILLGGMGNKCGVEANINHYGKLLCLANDNFKNAEVVTSWSAQDGFTLDGLPYIGKQSKQTPWLFLASGYEKWGMTQGTIAGHILCDVLCGDSNKFSEVFSPQRKKIGLTYLNAIKTNYSVLSHYVSGALKLRAPLCSHMKCRLAWNKDDQSWDCPCHGSRFDKYGNVLNTPAIKNIDEEKTDKN